MSALLSIKHIIEDLINDGEFFFISVREATYIPYGEGTLNACRFIE